MNSTKLVLIWLILHHLINLMKGSLKRLITLEGLSAFQARFLSKWLEALCRFSFSDSSKSTTAAINPGKVHRYDLTRELPNVRFVSAITMNLLTSSQVCNWCCSCSAFSHCNSINFKKLDLDTIRVGTGFSWMDEKVYLETMLLLLLSWKMKPHSKGQNVATWCM